MFDFKTDFCYDGVENMFNPHNLLLNIKGFYVLCRRILSNGLNVRVFNFTLLIKQT